MKLSILSVLMAAMVANGVIVSSAFAVGLNVQTRFELGEVIAEPDVIVVYFYDEVDSTSPWASQVFTANEVKLQKNTSQQVVGLSFVVTEIDTATARDTVWFETELDGIKVGNRQQIRAGVGGLTISGEIDTLVGVRFPDGLQTGVGITTELDPTVPAAIKDGIDWSELTGIPVGFADDTDDGISIEVDPTVAAHTTNANAHHTPTVLYTDADAVTAVKAVDGNGSGFDADLLDGQHASAFVEISGDNMTGALTTTIFGGAGAIKGANTNGPTNGYLGANGGDNFDNIASADWANLEIGVAGISTGVSSNDNYGVMGHSNFVGVRGEYSGSPTTNYAELGKNGIGIEAAGTTEAGKFIGDVNMYNGTSLAMTMGVANAELLLMDSSTGLLQTRIVGTSGTGGQMYMYDEAGSLSIRMDADDNPIGGGKIALHNAAGIVTITLDGDSAGDGRITTQEIRITGGSDLSEQFDIDSLTAKVEPGMLVSIDPLNPGKLIRSAEAYDRKVAGIVSGAGGIKPGMTMGQADTIANGEYPVALSGRVYAMVDASEHAVQPGDLLTTSATSGYAMKVIDYQRATGAVIGKAMTPLDGKTGLVLVLVNLQ